MKKILLLAGLGLAVLTVFTACQNPASVPSSTGSLSLSIEDKVSRTLLPSLSMTSVSYTVVGSGPGGAAFTQDTTGALIVNSLAFGSWLVTATAKNASGSSIGSGSGTVVVHSNESSNMAITVTPFTGNGTLNLNLNWTAADVEIAQVESILLPSNGSARELVFTLNGITGTASFAATDVPAGFHTLTLKLKDNGALVMGAVEVARIVKDQTTTGNYTFANINKPGGTVAVNITPEMADPLTVTIAGANANKPVNETMNLTASIAENGVNASYVWYVNGEAQGTGATFAFDSTWALGYYRIDVTAFSADGKRAGSSTQSSTVVPFLDPLSGVAYRNMVGVPGGTFLQSSGAASYNHSLSPFLIGQYEVTYELWYSVYGWAVTHGYGFSNKGIEGHDGVPGAAPSEARFEPVTTVNWREAMVWCNAYSQMTGNRPVYYSDPSLSLVLKVADDSVVNYTALGSLDRPYIDGGANGFRLPTEGEWQYAASYRDGTTWTPFNYASGATAGVTDGQATEAVAVYSSAGSRPVGTKSVNALGIYDMSGNIWEYCWDWYGSYPSGPSVDYSGPITGSSKVVKGGGWIHSASEMQVGARTNLGSGPYSEGYYIGFRVARSANL